MKNVINYYISNTDFTSIDNNGISMPSTWNNTTTFITFTAKAKEGFYFENIPQVIYFDYIGNQIIDLFVYDENKNIYTSTITQFNGYISVYANASASTSITNKFGLITIYTPTLNDLKAIADARYFYEIGENSERYYKDLGDFIANLHILYCKIDTNKKQRLYLGNYSIKNTDLLPVVDDNIIILDCGKIKINGKYKNVVDYKATIKIYLPFIGFKDLNTADYMDKTINLLYKCDIITGAAKAFLIIDNIIKDSFDCQISYKIPYVLLTDIEGKLDLNSNILYGFSAFVIVKYPIITGDNTTYGNIVNKVGLIGDFNGLTIFSDITLSTNATETECNEIINLLKNGVII